jgi:hypothetical protein
MTNVDKNVEINLPLENLIDTLCKLPPDTLREVKQRIERQLQEPDQSQGLLDDLHEDDLWGLEWSRESADDAEAPASMEEVLRITSKFKGSMAKIVSEERSAF